MEIPVWTEADKAIYEQQLEHLENQLTQALIDKQEMKGKIDTLNIIRQIDTLKKDTVRYSYIYTYIGTYIHTYIHTVVSH